MKLLTIIIFTTGTAALLLTAGCGDSLQERIERAKGDAWSEQQRDEQAEADVQEDYGDEWVDFRSAAETRLSANATRIHDITLRMATSDNTIRARTGEHRAALTRRNSELRVKLAGYKDVGKVNWDEFKRDFSHDLDELSRRVEDLEIDQR